MPRYSMRSQNRTCEFSWRSGPCLRRSIGICLLGGPAERHDWQEILYEGLLEDKRHAFPKRSHFSMPGNYNLLRNKKENI